MSPNFDSFAYDHPISGSGGKAIKITWQLIVWPFLKGRSNTALVTFAADLAGANLGICLAGPKLGPCFGPEITLHFQTCFYQLNFARLTFF